MSAIRSVTYQNVSVPTKTPEDLGKANAVEENELWELAAELDESLRREQESQAAAEQRGGRASERFLTRMAGTPTGEVLGLVTSDGALLRGQLLSVGADFVTLGETAERSGTERSRLLRVHEIPVGGIVRVVREP